MKVSLAVILSVFTLLLNISQSQNLSDDNTSAEQITPQYVHYSEYLKLCETHPHKSTSFTQGLFFYNGEMYESVGKYGESALYKGINIETGEHQAEYKFPDEIFAEGSVVFDDVIYLLTYKENKVFTFDPKTLSPKDTYSYARQGWGLTTDGTHLIASDGSSKLYFMDKHLTDIKQITVTYDGREVRYLNELEYINGNIWANVWLTDDVLVIDPETGRVIVKIDFSGLYEKDTSDPDAVLNGIAYDDRRKRVYLTGKRWGRIFGFEVE